MHRKEVVEVNETTCDEWQWEFTESLAIWDERGEAIVGYRWNAGARSEGFAPLLAAERAFIQNVQMFV